MNADQFFMLIVVLIGAAIAFSILASEYLAAKLCRFCGLPVTGNRARVYTGTQPRPWAHPRCYDRWLNEIIGPHDQGKPYATKRSYRSR